MRFERQQDIDRENKAMRTIANRYDWQYKKLGPKGGPTRTSADVSVPRLAGFSLITLI